MNHPKIKFTIKNYGEITAELYPEKAPKTVENFLSLVKDGFFEGLIFHRVINTSTLTMSPSASTRFPGMPWMTSSLILMQALAGKPL